MGNRSTNLTGRELGAFNVYASAGTDRKTGYELWLCEHVKSRGGCGATVILASQAFSRGAPRWCDSCRPKNYRKQGAW